MPHVSSRIVDKKTLDQIYNLLIASAASRYVSERQHRNFFNELFTPTEKIMLGKRLAAVALLSQGATPYYVSKKLRLSETTTGKILNRIEKQKLKSTVRLCSVHRKGPLGRYLQNLLRPLPKYGTSPSTLFKNQ